ncbi:hypothetical protein AVEN_5924-1 [Araneus ventricosus]|uniref:Uncharacterized protein n=1 Tax=Araneus ventricosus TaxID=182803 RepID=A0A4Y2EXA2_ARAVE|nr:hypothetical protein AVEN_5924-1 [Araneus ventricosus]
MRDLLAQSLFCSRSLAGRRGLEHQLWKRQVASSNPRTCSYSVFAIVCNEFDVANLTHGVFGACVNLLQACSKLALFPCQICCKLADLQSKIAAN